MNKLIFLDIDGVLNHQSMTRDQWRVDNGDGYLTDGLCPRSVSNLNELTDNTNADIVISSTWRVGRTVDELRDVLGFAGVTGNIIDKTPEFNQRSVFRGNEIYDWMKENIEESHNFQEYVILDDDSDMLYWQKDNFVIVDSFIGLTPRNIYKAERIMNRIA